MEPRERPSSEHVPVEVEHRLAGAGPDVDDHAVVLESLGGRCLGHEPQHPPGLLVRERVDLAECVDVTLGQHEQVRVRGRRDIADCDEAVGCVYVVAAGDEPAEEAARARIRRLRALIP